MEKFIYKIQLGIIGLLFARPLAVSAQSIIGTDNPDILNKAPEPVFTSFEGVVDIMSTFLGWLFTILMIVAAIFIIIAAFHYLTAGGDPDKVKTARNELIYAVVAIAIGLIATSVQFVVERLVTS